jgi:hypothetical protein
MKREGEGLDLIADAGVFSRKNTLITPPHTKTLKIF